ncbi:MAG: Flp pilus assembly protein TadD [Akkermansiaceae bacterium]|jgi:Flp pilus assembly protein TadD
MVTELQVERDGLVDERDRMKSLLKLNEADRVLELVTQNVTLNKELNEAQANLDAVQSEANSKKDVILLAKQQLVVAKFKIETLQKSNTQANLRMERLEKHLKQAEEDLLAQLNGDELNERGKEEVAMLREIIDKQRAKLAAQVGAAKLLMQQADRMGEKDTDFKDAMARINGDKKMELTIKELELLERTVANPSFTIDDRPTAQELDRATTDLRQMTEYYGKVSSRLFIKGDFEAARGTLQLIVDEDPGAWEAMVNLGIVHLRLQDPIAATRQFRQSILVTGDRKIPFAQFMLGDSLYRQGLYNDASDEIKRSLFLQPDNAKAHILLGNIAGKTNNATEAEFHFKEAISQDPTLFEPYFNLSIISFSKGQKDKAKEYYRDYLRRGGPANPTHEERLRQ